MTSASVTPDSLKATTELLRAELPQLEEHQQSLEGELAAVTERLEFVRTALAALQALSLAPYVPAPAGSADTSRHTDTPTETEPDSSVATAPADNAEEPTSPVGPGRRTAATVVGQKRRTNVTKKEDHLPSPARKSTTSKRTKVVAQSRPEAPVRDKDAGLTEQVIAVLSKSGGSPVRARDVASALGRDETAGSVNAVRSTLDRLVATSRAHRAGRGLYQARS